MRRVIPFVFLLGALATGLTMRAQEAGKVPESPCSTIGYTTVATALIAVRAISGIEIRTENGWLIATDSPMRTIWSFAPEGHPAYPTAVKRTVVPAQKGSVVDMQILCESDKVSCDNVVLQFQEINRRLFGSPGVYDTGK
jgi:hypothetical protein